ncbi:rab1_6 [Blepharisma stoltei]|uniref:Uncharacterized protein n=1 Tax=Blepharisma stoltei TaxID=1481888 RepID=A0AAU9JM99_9CILI|nr:unnamed protein product [Blepharisma stoltei]
MRFAENCFSHNYISTIGVECKSRTIELGDKRVRIQLWDTAGQERYRTITSNFYRGSHGIAVAYDVTDRNSFNMVTSWLAEIAKNSSDNSITVIIANKIDMINHRQVTEEEGRNLAESHKLHYFETSAKDGSGVAEAFRFMASKIVASMEIKPDYIKRSKESFMIKRMEKEPAKKEKCC